MLARTALGGGLGLVRTTLVTAPMKRIVLGGAYELLSERVCNCVFWAQFRGNRNSCVTNTGQVFRRAYYGVNTKSLREGAG